MLCLGGAQAHQEGPDDGASSTLEDLDGSIEAVLFPQTYEKCRVARRRDAVVRVKGRVEEDDRGRKLIVSDIEPFDGTDFASRRAESSSRPTQVRSSTAGPTRSNAF